MKDKKNKIINGVVCVLLVASTIGVSVGMSGVDEEIQEQEIEKIGEPTEGIEEVKPAVYDEMVVPEAAEEVVEEPVVETQEYVQNVNTQSYGQSYSQSQQSYSYNTGGSNGVLTQSGGVNYYNGNKETYYNLDMSGVISNAQNMGIQGNYWVRDDGVKMYGDYVIVASQHDKGSIIETSLGTGIVLDYCPAGTIDVATAW